MTGIFIWDLLLFQRSIFIRIIWMVKLLFHEATCSHLLFSMVLYFFQTSICSHLLLQRYWPNFPTPVAVILSLLRKRAVAAILTKQLQSFVLASFTFQTTTLSKALLFRSTYFSIALISFWVTKAFLLPLRGTTSGINFL